MHLAGYGGEQHSASYESMNPMQQVPLLVVPRTSGDPICISQSLAILEFLEETFPEPCFLPGDAAQRAHIRECAELVNAGIQPLQNLGVLQSLERAGVDKNEWAADAIDRGLRALEALTVPLRGRFLIGDTPTLADLCLVPQLGNARRFGVALDSFTSLLQAEAACRTLDAFRVAHPDRQPDAPVSD